MVVDSSMVPEADHNLAAVVAPAPTSEDGEQLVERSGGAFRHRTPSPPSTGVPQPHDLHVLSAKNNIIAQEFFDTLPVYKFQKASRSWCEKMVDVAEDSSGASGQQLRRYQHKIEVCLKAMELTQTIIERKDKF